MTIMGIFNHDTGVFELRGDIVSEARALAAIETGRKGRNITGVILRATDMDAARREAETMQPNYFHVKSAFDE
jgi:hypothetical protein